MGTFVRSVKADTSSSGVESMSNGENEPCLKKYVVEGENGACKAIDRSGSTYIPLFCFSRAIVAHHKVLILLKGYFAIYKRKSSV